MHHVSDDFLCETSPSLGKIHTNTLETHHWQINAIKNNLKIDIYVFSIELSIQSNILSYRHVV